MDLDYKKLGLKCGIEIHQQLEGKKLFCNCSTIIRDDKPDFEIKRKLRASKGESGKIDKAAKQEQLKSKYFIYQGYYDSTCLVESDDEPPHEMNKDALYSSLQVSKMLNAKIIDQIQVMRKIVVDGSNTSGFQRTSLVGINGFLDVNNKKIGIPSICIEEDACKIVERKQEFDIYNLSRLGIPLIEIATDPDIKTPEECKLVAQEIGFLLRSLPNVKRGLGTIRQDVNVSIIGGTRIEIKGAQDLKMLPTIVEFEATRQKILLEIKDELNEIFNKNNFEISDLKNEKINLSNVLKNCESKVVKFAFENKGVVYGIKLNYFSGFLGREVQIGRRLGTELSDYGKVKAGVKGLFHSDELPKYGITQEEVNTIRKELKCNEEDGFIIIADKANKVEIALDAAYDRAKLVLKEIPKEVRKANQDGTSSYLRPMPGASRMYPETDIPKIIPNVKDIKIPELLKEKISRFEKDLYLGKDLSNKIVRIMPEFDEFMKNFKDLKASFVAETIVSSEKNIKKQFNIEIEISEQEFLDVFTALDNKKIPKGAILDVLAGKKKIDDFELLSEDKVREILIKVVEENKGAPFGGIMGAAMKKLGGKASGQVVSRLLKEIVD